MSVPKKLHAWHSGKCQEVLKAHGLTAGQQALGLEALLEHQLSAMSTNKHMAHHCGNLFNEQKHILVEV